MTPKSLLTKKITRREFLSYSGFGLFALSGISRRPKPAWLSAAGAEPEYPLGRVIDDSIDLYDQPSLVGKKIKKLWKDNVLKITDVTVGDASTTYNRIWYKLNDEGYAGSGGIQPVQIITASGDDQVPATGCLGEVTVPFTDSHWWPGQSENLALRLYYATTYWVIEYKLDRDQKGWYGLADEKLKTSYYAQANHIRLIPDAELAPINPYVPPEAKRLEVHLDEQIVIAYEQDIPIFMSRTATGGKFSNGDFTTPRGRHIIYSKRGSRHMAAGDRAAANSYDLPGIPWVSYITEDGIAFHGTYWHNDFGHPRSHGCINLSPQAARWIYLWSNPVMLPGEPKNFDPNGTVVDVI